MKYLIRLAFFIITVPCGFTSNLDDSGANGQLSPRGPKNMNVEQIKNCALLGAGKQAGRLVHAIKESGGRVVTLFSRDLEKGNAFAAAQDLGKVVVTDKLEEAVGHDLVGSVFVSTPDYCHHEHAMTALKSGKHVFLEKPLAIDEKQADEILDLANKSRLRLVVGYHMRYSRALRHLHDLIKQGEFGDIHKAHITWSLKPEKTEGWRNNENPWWVLSLLGTHCIDQALWLFGEPDMPMIHFEGTKNNRTYGLKNEDSAHMGFTFPNKANTVVEIDCRLVKEEAEVKPLTISLETGKGNFVFNKLLGQGQEITIGEKRTTFDYQNPWDKAVGDFFTAIEKNVYSSEETAHLFNSIATSHGDAKSNVKVLNLIERADNWQGK